MTMSSKELIESLRRSGEEKIRLLRQEAEQEAKAFQAAATERLAELRRQNEARLAAATGEETVHALAEAGNKARAIRLSVEQQLSERLLSVSRTLLQQVRNNGYPALFEKMAIELPSLAWNLVRVHPADVDLARKYFPDAEVVPVETFTGGMDVTIRDGTIRVINTLEKRLERAWNELLPLMVKDVYREVGDGTSPEPR